MCEAGGETLALYCPALPFGRAHFSLNAFRKDFVEVNLYMPSLLPAFGM